MAPVCPQTYWTPIQSPGAFVGLRIIRDSSLHPCSPFPKPGKPQEFSSLDGNAPPLSLAHTHSAAVASLLFLSSLLEDAPPPPLNILWWIWGTRTRIWCRCTYCGQSLFKKKSVWMLCLCMSVPHAHSVLGDQKTTLDSLELK